MQCHVPDVRLRLAYNRLSLVLLGKNQCIIHCTVGLEQGPGGSFSHTHILVETRTRQMGHSDAYTVYNLWAS